MGDGGSGEGDGELLVASHTASHQLSFFSLFPNLTFLSTSSSIVSEDDTIETIELKEQRDKKETSSRSSSNPFLSLYISKQQHQNQHQNQDQNQQEQEHHHQHSIVTAIDTQGDLFTITQRSMPMKRYTCGSSCSM